MYRLALIMTLIILGNKTIAQFSLIGVERDDILFAGVDNKISIVVENTLCNSIIIKTTNGKIIGQNCQYIYSINFDSVQQKGITDTRIEVYKKFKNQLKLLSSKFFYIRKIPDPQVCIVKCEDSKIKYSFFQKSTINDGHQKPPNLRAEVPFFLLGIPSDSRFIIDSFYSSVYRGDSCIVKPILNKGNYFTDETYEGFKLLKENDTIIFDKIYAKGSDGSKRLLQPVTILVTK
jgi:hypothetical protein